MSDYGERAREAASLAEDYLVQDDERKASMQFTRASVYAMLAIEDAIREAASKKEPRVRYVDAGAEEEDTERNTDEAEE